ncbi:hypothetical protein COO60DRAFT_1479735 [Scenedesmus sp. NREL 46B-D3]|nr:hypothetical protein COO60DRAFT_1479735 [Scenedesmus sp. NREL 46B-D3]
MMPAICQAQMLLQQHPCCLCVCNTCLCTFRCTCVTDATSTKKTNRPHIQVQQAHGSKPGLILQAHCLNQAFAMLQIAPALPAASPHSICTSHASCHGTCLAAEQANTLNHTDRARTATAMLSAHGRVHLRCLVRMKSPAPANTLQLCRFCPHRMDACSGHCVVCAALPAIMLRAAIAASHAWLMPTAEVCSACRCTQLQLCSRTC